MLLIEVEMSGNKFMTSPTSVAPAARPNSTTIGFTHPMYKGYTMVELSYAQVKQAIIDAQAAGDQLLDMTKDGVAALNQKYAHLRDPAPLKQQFGRSPG